MPSYTLLTFCKTDGTTSLWPTCGSLADGGALNQLLSNDEYAVQFLGKLELHLTELLGYPGA